MPLPATPSPALRATSPRGGEGERLARAAEGAAEKTPSPLWGEGGRRPGEGEMPLPVPPLTRPSGDLSPRGRERERLARAAEGRPPQMFLSHLGESGRFNNSQGDTGYLQDVISTTDSSQECRLMGH